MNNIKCGNSLIGSDYYVGKQTTMFDEEEMYKVNAFDWEKEFEQIIKAGGFDVVIGNPPWGAESTEPEQKYYRRKNSKIIVRMTDSYMFFINSSVTLLSNQGRFGMIIPSTLLTQTDMSLLRRHLCNNFILETVINLGDKVFGQKVLNTSTILTFNKKDPIGNKIIVGDLRHNGASEKQNLIEQIKPTNKKNWLQAVKSDPGYTYFTLNLSAVSLFQKLAKNLSPFKRILDGKIERGISPDYANAFVVENKDAQKNKIEKDILYPLILGRHISRYGSINASTSIIYLTRNDDINKYPKAKAHLSKYRNKITCKEVSQGKHPWYSLHRPRDPEIFQSPKFIGLRAGSKITFHFFKELAKENNSNLA